MAASIDRELKKASALSLKEDLNKTKPLQLLTRYPQNICVQKDLYAADDQLS